MHPVKRRKLDQVNATLIKPFRSPMRVDSQLLTLQTPEHRNSLPRRAPPLSTSPIKDPELALLQKQYTTLSRELTTLRQSLDTAQQALKIETTNQHSELQALIVKWRAVAKDAAEELFDTAKSRVDRMGGVRMWRENAQKTPQFWDDESFEESQLSEEQIEQLEQDREESRAEAEKYGLIEQKSVEENEDDDNTFTMEMMLRQMNIELDIVGYNKHLQRWVDSG